MATSTKSQATAPKLLTELQRQDAVLAELDLNKYEFPLFNGRRAVESQRKSGYKSTPRAAREIIDNAVEAGAKHVWVAFRRKDESERVKRQWKDSVSAIAIIDDGPGMRPQMARFALTWGGGTRFDNPTGIGRFGFGLPNSSINQTRVTEVYTRTSADETWSKAVLDIRPEKLSLHGVVTVDPVETGVELPDWVTEYLETNDIELGSGTVVIWEKPDHLSARSAGKLRGHMLDDFGGVYRYLLDSVEIVVDNTKVEKVDPLFRMADARFYKPEEEGGAWCTFEKSLTVKYSRNDETGTQQLELLTSQDDIRAARKQPGVIVDVISVRVTGFPYGFVAKSVRTGYDEQGREIRTTLPQDSPERKRMQIRSTRRGISFVRANREIDTLSYLPTSQADKASGLGNWPVLQSYALHWGAEVRFSPKLDDAFGLGNDKQHVSPVEDVWRVLHEAKVDAAIQHEEALQEEMRKKDREKHARQEAENPDVPNPATEAAAMTDQVLGPVEPLPEDRVKEAAGRFEETVNERVKKEGKPRAEVEEEERAKAEEKKYAINFFTTEGGVFYRPDFGNGLQTVAMINTAHPFFQVFYTAVASMPNPRARQVVDLLLCALAKAELDSGGVAKTIYKTQREDKWSPFLKLGLSLLEDLQPADAEEQQEDADA
jgi:hypothetical protein